MCQFSHIRLSPAEQKEVRKLSGVMIPIYASVALLLLAVISLTNAPRSNEIPRSNELLAIAKNSGSAADTAPAR